MRRCWFVVLAATTACGGVEATIDAPLATPDAVADATSIDAAPLGPFGTPQPVAGINQVDTNEDDVSLTDDQLEIYFASDRTGAAGGVKDIWVATRTSTSQPWGTPTPVAAINSDAADGTPRVGHDGLTLWFSSDRPGGQGLNDVYVSVRAARTAPWGAPVVVTELSSAAIDQPGSVTADGLRIAVYSTRAGATTGQDLYESTRSAPGASWSTPVAITALNTDQNEMNPHLTGDGTGIYFVSNRTGAASYDVFHATRPSLTAPFATPTPVSEVNSADGEGDPWVSPDERTIYFSRQVGTAIDLFVAVR